MEWFCEMRNTGNILDGLQMPYRFFTITQQQEATRTQLYYKLPTVTICWKPVAKKKKKQSDDAYISEWRQTANRHRSHHEENKGLQQRNHVNKNMNI